MKGIPGRCFPDPTEQMIMLCSQFRGVVTCRLLPFTFDCYSIAVDFDIYRQLALSMLLVPDLGLCLGSRWFFLLTFMWWPWVLPYCLQRTYFWLTPFYLSAYHYGGHSERHAHFLPYQLALTPFVIMDILVLISSPLSNPYSTQWWLSQEREAGGVPCIPGHTVFTQKNVA